MSINVQNKKRLNIIISLTVLVLFCFALFKYVLYLIDVPLMNVKLPVEIPVVNNNLNSDIERAIALTWTDDNSNENLIIQTDQKTYYGFNKADIYFSITNTSRREQKTNINMLFKDRTVSLKNVERISVNNNEKNKLALADTDEQANLNRLNDSRYDRK
ncbi:hypothetical protein KAK05_03360, partial [Candidatus Parcubacteria bacterium]|nr:hypothetical protein [Candidatus Parcubacteria bacterium]